MTLPVGSPPLCSVWIDGVRMADGQISDDELAPTVLTDLAVVWGRPNNLDQPAAATATFEVMDLAGGQTFASQLHIGAQCDVRTDATLYPDPTLEMLVDGGFEQGTQTWVASNAQARVDTIGHSGSKSLRINAIDGTKLATIDLPPGPLSSDPSAWNAIPRAAFGQRWDYSAWVQLSSQLGVLNQQVTIKPLAYLNPNGSGVQVIPGSQASWGPGGPAGWSKATGSVLPPNDAWVGLRVEIYPSGPSWLDVPPAVTWGSLAARSNLALNPRCIIDAGADQAGWTASRWAGSGGAATNTRGVAVTGHPAGITTAMQKLWTKAPTGNGDTGLDLRKNATDYWPVTPGQTVSASIWVRATSSTGDK